MVKQILITVFVTLFSLINVAQTSLEINVKNNKKGCVIEKKVVIPYKYKDILIQDTLIKAKSFNNQWRLFKINGEKLLKGKSYKSIDIYKKVIICKTQTYVDIYMHDVKIAKADEVVVEGKDLLLLVQGFYSSIINFDGIFIIPEKIYEDVLYNDEFGCIEVTYEDKNFKRTDKNGRSVVVGAYQMGLIDSKTKEFIVPCKFQNIKRDKEGQVWVKKQKSSYGQKIKWEKYP